MWHPSDLIFLLHVHSQTLWNRSLFCRSYIMKLKKPKNISLCVWSNHTTVTLMILRFVSQWAEDKLICKWRVLKLGFIFAGCKYNQVNSHFHCIREGCQFSFLLKHQMTSHARKHMRRMLGKNFDRVPSQVLTHTVTYDACQTEKGNYLKIWAELNELYNRCWAVYWNIFPQAKYLTHPFLRD